MAMSKTESLAETFDYFAPYPFAHGGFEIPQTESALARVRTAIDVVMLMIKKPHNKVSPVRQPAAAL